MTDSKIPELLAELEKLDPATMETWAEQCGEHPSTRWRNAAFLQVIPGGKTHPGGGRRAEVDM